MAVGIPETRMTENPRSGIPGNVSLEKFPREFPGILLRSAFNLLYTIILSFDNCSYSARHNVKVHYNFVDYIFIILLIRLELRKNLSRDFSAHKSDLDEFTNVFPSTNPVSPARRLMILHRTHPSILFDIRMIDLHRCPV